MAVKTYRCTRGPWWSFISLQRDTALMLAGLTADRIRRRRSNEFIYKATSSPVSPGKSGHLEPFVSLRKINYHKNVTKMC